MSSTVTAAPLPLSHRALAPDLGRGLLLLAIALANAALYRYGPVYGIRLHPLRPRRGGRRIRAGGDAPAVIRLAGRLQVESTPGGGTALSTALPAITAEPVRKPAGEPVEEVAAS